MSSGTLFIYTRLFSFTYSVTCTFPLLSFLLFLPSFSSYVCHIIVESLKSRFIVTFSFVFILITLQANFMLKETNVDYI